MASPRIRYGKVETQADSRISENITELGTLDQSNYGPSNHEPHLRTPNFSNTDQSRKRSHNDPSRSSRQLGGSATQRLLAAFVDLLGAGIALIFAIFGFLVLKHDGDVAEPDSVALKLVAVSKYVSGQDTPSDMILTDV